VGGELCKIGVTDASVGDEPLVAIVLLVSDLSQVGESSDMYRVIASHATSERLKMRSSGLSYSGLRRTFVQFLRLVQVSSGVLPLKGGKPARNSKSIQPRDQ
jgi:hypothetical protein